MPTGEPSFCDAFRENVAHDLRRAFAQVTELRVECAKRATGMGSTSRRQPPKPLPICKEAHHLVQTRHHWGRLVPTSRWVSLSAPCRTVTCRFCVSGGQARNGCAGVSDRSNS